MRSLKSFHPDQFFSIEQQKRLSELMEMWRTARNEGLELSQQLQAELDNLVEVELKAATARTTSFKV